MGKRCEKIYNGHMFSHPNTRFCNRTVYTFGATVIFHIFKPLMNSKKKQTPDLEEMNTLCELEF